jgi:hypothetical protein
MFSPVCLKQGGAVDPTKPSPKRRQQGTTHPCGSHRQRSLKAQIRFCTAKKTGWIKKTAKTELCVFRRF